MKALLIGECRQGKLLETTYELVTFAADMGAEAVMFLAGYENEAPKFDGTLYLADAEKYGEIDSDIHKEMILGVVETEKPDYIIFSHSAYGWDMAPRIAYALEAAQVSEAVRFADGAFVTPACNGKLQRVMKPKTEVCVVTVQSGAVNPPAEPSGTPEIKPVESSAEQRVEFAGYEEAEEKTVDLGKAEVIVTAGRGVGKAENIDMVKDLAKTLGGQLGATRPVVDSGWAPGELQVGTSGQTVSPKLYIACGVSGAIQHLAGMKKSEFIVAVNTDKDAPIGEVADVMVIADLKQFVPALTEKLKG